MGCACDKLDVILDAKCGRMPSGNRHFAGISEEQTDNVKQNWQVLKQDIANIGVRTFIRFVYTFSS